MINFRLEEVKCLCGKEGSMPLAIIELKDGKDVRIVECKACGLHYMNPRPDREFLNWMYKEGYYSSVIENKKIWAEKTLKLERDREKIHLYRLRHILRMRDQYGYKRLFSNRPINILARIFSLQEEIIFYARRL